MEALVTCMEAAYYEEQLPVIWGEADLQKAAEKIKSFFRLVRRYWHYLSIS